jgi:iron complex transport system ATP-binding protein
MGIAKTAISVKDLNFAYSGSVILNEVTIDIASEKFTVILGRNGSGKSTFLRILAGLLPCSGGAVKIHGNDSSRLTYSDRSKLTGFLNQQHKAIFPFSVSEVVLTGRAGYINYSPKEIDRIAASDAMRKVGIGYLKDRKYNELSGGEQQLVLIARVLAQKPKILLLDEPTSHLDLYYQTLILKLLNDLTKEGLTIICVLHDPNLAFLNADEFIFLKDHRVIRPDYGISSWDIEFLRTIYDLPLKAIPYNGRSLIITQVE